MRLLFRPIPYDGESAASFLIRAAEENGHSSVYRLFAAIGIQINEPTLRACIIDRHRYRILIQSLGLSADAAKLALPRISTSRRSPRLYHSMAIPDRCFRRDDARAFCSQCLTEKPYWRQQWLVRPFSACTDHQCLLVDRCEKCGKAPSIGRGELTTCDHCEASLLIMHGPPVTDSAMVAVQGMLKSKSADSLGKVLDFWGALVRFDGLDDSPATEHTRLNLSVSFLNGERTAFDHVAALVIQRLATMGPGIQLLPFLSGSPMLKSFAEEVLTHVWPLVQAGAGDARLSRLSKGEVCTLLNMSYFKLTQLIKSSQIHWPSNDGRQQKIAATENELRQHGFSETEILYATAEEIDAPLRRRYKPGRRGQ
ncbi:TniQ family protein [Duganella sp.]|uniref:TniQ family protein n=1 Tax=Duganella sp. TaxID=1904440 RepID=UPI0031D0AEE6